MTLPPDRPEFWVEDAADGPGDWLTETAWSGGDSLYGSQVSAWDTRGHDALSRPAGGAPAGSDSSLPGRGPAGPTKGSRRWVRWAAAGAGFVVIAGIIAWQSRPGQGESAADGSDTSRSTASTTVQSTVMQSAVTAPTSTGAAAATDPGNSSDPDARLPTTRTALPPMPLDNATWQLVGYGPEGVIRYTPATGQLVSTPVPALGGLGPLSLATTADAVLVGPMAAINYLVPDGQAAEPVAGWLINSSSVLPGPSSGTVWAVLNSDIRAALGAAVMTVVTATGDEGSTVVLQGTDARSQPAQAQLVLVDEHGDYAGAVLDLPEPAGAGGGYTVRPDGTGFALFDGVGGTYRLGLDGARLVTHGRVLATGPAAILTYECDDDAQCGLAVIDQATGQRRSLPAETVFPPGKGFTAGATGVTSPDGAWAVLHDSGTSDISFVNLTTGTVITPSIDIGSPVVNGTSGSDLAFSPDGRYLLVALDSGVLVIDPATGNPRELLPVPPLAAIAVRPAA